MANKKVVEGIMLQDGTIVPFEDARIPAPPQVGVYVLYAENGVAKWLPPKKDE